MEIADIVKKMTLEEKAAFVSGVDFWETNPILRLEIPSMYMTDGPCGLRKQGGETDHLGLNHSEATTSFPAGATFGASWNIENMKKMGTAVARECQCYGVNMILGPAVNIKRNPRCGRNFEYISEDPFLSGEMGKAFVLAVQEEGIGTSVKHFAVNNNEDYRFMGDSIVDERALREIYLKAFEKVVKESQPAAVMSAYNKVNGVFCCENEYLLNQILRKEWGFKGAVISDWGGVSNRKRGIEAGMDLEMPGECDYFRGQIIEGVKKGELDEALLDQSVKRVLHLIKKTKITKKVNGYNKDEHNLISEEIAVDGAVLLKNECILPLNKEERFLVVGELFQKMRYQGAGSSLINPTRLTTPENAFLHRQINIEFALGYRESDVNPDETLENEAIEKAQDFETVLFFGGQTDYVESEGYDRSNIKLPSNQISLINKLLDIGKKVIYIMYGGSPVELPFESRLSAVLNMYLPGQAGGEATAQLLFGEKTPSGKLAETWLKSYVSVPFGDEFAQTADEYYKESIFTGYRYYDYISQDKIQYPFGYGLSYTQFVYHNPAVKNENELITIECEIENSGKYDGAEVVQVYVGGPSTDVFKPVKELRGFQKIMLSRGKKEKIVIDIPIKDLAYYNIDVRDWIIENGTYTIYIASSSQDIRHVLFVEIGDQKEVDSPYLAVELPHYYNVSLLESVTKQETNKLLNRNSAEVVIKKGYTMDSKLADIKASFIGKIFYSAVVGTGEKQYKEALKMPFGPERDMKQKNGLFLMKMLPNNSLRSMSASSSGRFPYNIAEGLVDLLNHKYLSGILKMTKKTKVPGLPKKQKQR
jgi:beta-glucosidase